MPVIKISNIKNDLPSVIKITDSTGSEKIVKITK
jgi:hypothetical protein